MFPLVFLTFFQSVLGPPLVFLFCRKRLCPEDQYLKKEFRVEREYVSGESVFGKVGTCVYAHQEEQEISLMDSTMSILRVPVSACSEMTKSIPKPRPMMTFEHVGKKVRLQMLGRLGMVSPESAPPVEFKKNEGLVEGQTIQIWAVLLEQTFPEVSFFSWSPDSMYVYFQMLQQQDTEGSQLLAEAFRRSVSRYDKVFFPVQCPEGAETHESGHWTLLVVESVEEGMRLEEPRIRYYETMNDVNEVCLQRAQVILQEVCPTLSPKALVNGLSRHQVFRQKGTDCGYWVMHYIELEVRKLSGEGSGPVTTPTDRKQTMVSRVKAAVKQLEKARQGWLEEASVEEMKRKTAQAILQAKTTKAKSDLKEAEDLRRRAEEAALVSIWCKTLPDAIPEDPQEVRRMLSLERKAQLRQEVQAAVREILGHQSGGASCSATTSAAKGAAAGGAAQEGAAEAQAQLFLSFSLAFP